jgi:hypothetical protein
MYFSKYHCRELLIPVVTEGKHYVPTADDFSDDIRE